jgi:hypothetical protein
VDDKMYSKRERKPKVWAGFETEAPSENQVKEVFLIIQTFENLVNIPFYGNLIYI